MNYKDLQNIAFLSQEILTESATKEHNALDRWPYTSPYLQESTEVDEAKFQLPEAVFNQEYLANPMENAANPFGSVHITNCIEPLSTNPDVSRNHTPPDVSGVVSFGR